MLIGTLGARLLGNLLNVKGTTRLTSQGQVINKKGKGINRPGEGFVRADYDNKENFNTASSFN